MLDRTHQNLLKKSAVALALAAIAIPVLAASNEELDRRIRILERQLENQQEGADAKAKDSAKVTADSKGFTISSANGDYSLSLGGVLQTDARFFYGDAASAGFADQFVLRRAEPSLKGNLGKYVSFVITPQFGGSTSGTRLLDFYTDLKLHPAASFRVGRFKEGVGLENLQSTPAITFIERGLTNNLSPTRELGVALNGRVLSETLQYSIGIFNGASEGSDGADVAEADNRHEYVARIFAEPFKNDPGLFQGLGFGVAGTAGVTKGNAANLAANPLISAGSGSYVSTGQNKIFGYLATGTTPAATDTFADGQHDHLAPQLYWYYNNYGLLGEYLFADAEVLRAGHRDTLRHRAHQVIFNYVITGEDTSFKGVKPAQPFTLDGEGWGAFEVALRTSGLNIDGDSFAGTATTRFADPTKSISRAREYGLAANWYWNANTKLALNYEFTTFKGGSTAGDRDSERAVLGRLQVAF